MLAMLIVNDYLLGGSARGGLASSKPFATAAYLVGQGLPIITGAEGFASFLDVIVPLTGRTGVDAPADHIIASVVGGLVYLLVPTLPMLAHRFGKNVLTQAIVLTLFVSGGIISIFAAPGMQPFDFLHPKRVLCLYMEDTATGSLSLHVAGLDPTPFANLVDNLAGELQLAEKPVLSEIRDDIADWDIVGLHSA